MSFENKHTKNRIKYSRYIASWSNSGMLQKYGFDDEFISWLKSENLSYIEISDIYNMATFGKHKLEKSIKEFMKEIEPHFISPNEFGKSPCETKVHLIYNLSDKMLYYKRRYSPEELALDLRWLSVYELINSKKNILTKAGDTIFIRYPVEKFDVKIVAHSRVYKYPWMR